jgi:hypothetical protein
MINTESEKHDKYEKWEMLNYFILFIIKNEHTEPNLIYRFYLLLNEQTHSTFYRVNP